MEQIIISIVDEDGNVLFAAECKSVDSAIAELGRYDRNKALAPQEHD